jgi:hypothetical protein
MTTMHDTDHMIRRLAGQAGARQSAPRYGAALTVGVVLSVLSAVTLAVLLFDVRQGAPASTPFHYKAVSMAALTAGGIVLARFAGLPGYSSLAFMSLLPGVAVLLLGAATDISGLPVLGGSEFSVPSCVAAIVSLSLPGLAGILAAMRWGVPTRPALAGAVAGLLAGAIGGAAYALVCKNDGALFVTVWYTAAIAIVAGLGALIGRKILAW